MRGMQQRFALRRGTSFSKPWVRRPTAPITANKMHRIDRTLGLDKWEPGREEAGIRFFESSSSSISSGPCMEWVLLSSLLLLLRYMLSSSSTGTRWCIPSSWGRLCQLRNLHIPLEQVHVNLRPNPNGQLLRISNASTLRKEAATNVTHPRDRQTWQRQLEASRCRR